MKKCGPFIFVGGLLFLATVLVVFLVALPAFIDSKLKQELQLRNGTDTWDKWVDVPIPTYMTMYIFHVLNPKAIEKGEKFQFEEKGPYVYEEKRYKEILDVNDQADTVTYKEIIIFNFREDMSHGNKDTDIVNVINLPFITAATILKKVFYGLANFPLDYLWRKGESFVKENVSVKDLLFDGFDISPYLDLISWAPGGPPAGFEGGKFAFYSTKNGVSHDIYTVKRGVKDSSEFGQIVAYNGNKELTYWPNPDQQPYEEQWCQQINGSDGSIIPPFVTKDRVMYIFTMDVCRSLHATYQRESEFDGIPGYRFGVPPEVLLQGAKNPANKCFCPPPGGGMKSHCDMDGVSRLYPCRFGAPILVSFPHFLDGSEHLLDLVEGLQPDREKHETFFDIEPRTGLIMNAKKRLQINIEMEPLDGIILFRNVTAPYVIAPVMWAEERGALNDELSKEIKNVFLKPLKIMNIVQWVLVGFSILMVIFGAIKTYRSRKQ